MSTALPNKVPHHVAIIMDGNGRWAKQRTWNRIRGHREGAKRVDEIVTECTALGVKYLTLYTFSTENWNRPKTEVDLLMQLLAENLKTMDKKLLKNKVALKTQGQVDRIPDFAKRELDRVEKLTCVENPNMILNLALSYGGRHEIVRSAQKLAEEVLAGTLKPEDINEDTFKSHLYHPEIPDPDLLIRTGGEQRISNFLLWEIAYTEIYVTDVLWPEFGPKDLRDAFEDFGSRQRRFGKTSEQILKPEVTL